MNRYVPFTGAGAALAVPPNEALATGSQPPATLATTGTWTAAGDLPTPGYWAIPTDSSVVLDGKVLVAGGEDGARNAHDAVALFDPEAVPDPTKPDVKGAWTALNPLTVSRRLHSVTKLADGRVLVAGGISGAFSSPPVPVASAEIYDPATGAWTPTTTGMKEARFGHSATLIAGGKVLVAGGLAPRDAQTSTALASAEIFDPATGEWTPTLEPMHDARSGHSSVTIAGGKVLVVGGMAPIGRGLYTGQAFCEIFDPASGKWTPTGSLGTVRKGHQATVLANGSVLVTGGDSTGMQEDWTFNPYSQWTTEIYTPSSGTWAPAEGMSTGRSHHRAIALSSGKVLVIGGTDDATFDVGYQNAEVYDPAAKTWTPTGGMVTGRWAFAAAEFADDGRVVVAGGLVRSGGATPDNVDIVTAASEVFKP